MTRLSLLLLLAALGPAAACGARAAASLDEDTVPEASRFDRVIELQAQVDLLEGRPVLARNPDALTRMRRWLDRLAAAPPEEAAVYELAVRAQLEYLRTSELRHAAEAEGQP